MDCTWTCQGEIICKKKNDLTSMQFDSRIFQENTIEHFYQYGCKITIPNVKYYDTKPGAIAISTIDYANLKNNFVINSKFRLLSLIANRPSNMNNDDPVYVAGIKQRNSLDNTLVFTGTSSYNTNYIWINFKGNELYLNNFVYPDNCTFTLCFI
jgi:hypothetical protein